jgi:lipopolysaccharide transport system permease protein
MEYEIKPVGKLSLGLSELVDYRELFYFFTWRDIKIKYKQTVFGVAWAVLQPFLLMLVFNQFFSRVFKPPGDVPYPVFVYSGLLLWNIFSSGLANASNSMVSNANIIKKIYFPRLIIPMSSILVALFDFLMALAVYIGLLFYYRYSVDWTVIIYLPLSILITVLATFGLGTFIAALNVKYRDFRYIIPFMIQILLFLTPVIYPITSARPWIQNVLMLNPMSGAIDLFRSSVTHQPVNGELVAVGFIMSIIFFVSGMYYFRKTEYYFADIA